MRSGLILLDVSKSGRVFPVQKTDTNIVGTEEDCDTSRKALRGGITESGCNSTVETVRPGIGGPTTKTNCQLEAAEEDLVADQGKETTLQCKTL